MGKVFNLFKLDIGSIRSWSYFRIALTLFGTTIRAQVYYGQFKRVNMDYISGTTRRSLDWHPNGFLGVGRGAWYWF